MFYIVSKMSENYSKIINPEFFFPKLPASMFCQILKAMSDVFPKALKQWSNSAFKAVGTLQLKKSKEKTINFTRDLIATIYFMKKNILLKVP